MKVIAIYNFKGGVGKTTTTKFLAKYFAEKRGKRVLLVDMDPQANLSSQFIISNETNRTTYHLLLEDSASLKNCISKTTDKNIDIIISDFNLLKANNELLQEAITKPPAGRLAKKMVSNDTKDYDYILIDCPPTMDLLVTNSLVITDEIIIPVKADRYSVDGLEMMLEKINEIKNSYNENLKISSIFLNQYKHTNLHKELFTLLNEQLEYMNANYIGDYSIVSRDTVSDDTKIEKHKITEQYDKLFSSIMDEINEFN